jgi:hypothetical protein
MSVPNRFIVVDRVFAESGPWDLTTHDGCGLFTEAAARALWREDPDFGHLRKTPGHNQYNGHAVDAVLYRPTGQTIDLIAFSETPQARPAWQEDIPRYSDADWYAPDLLEPVPAPVDPPPPPVDPPPPPPRPPVVPIAIITAIVATLGRIEAKQDALAAQSDANTARIQSQIDQVVQDLEATAANYLPLLNSVLLKLLP